MIHCSSSSKSCNAGKQALGFWNSSLILQHQANAFELISRIVGPFGSSAQAATWNREEIPRFTSEQEIRDHHSQERAP